MLEYFAPFSSTAENSENGVGREGFWKLRESDCKWRFSGSEHLCPCPDSRILFMSYMLYTTDSFITALRSYPACSRFAKLQGERLDVCLSTFHIHKLIENSCMPKLVLGGGEHFSSIANQGYQFWVLHWLLKPAAGSCWAVLCLRRRRSVWYEWFALNHLHPSWIFERMNSAWVDGRFAKMIKVTASI